jgi:GNAT superfamily N-acetyltransferase
VHSRDVLSNYRIALARRSDISRLKDVELAAARLLVGHAPESVLAEATRESEFVEAIRNGLLWVAIDGSQPVGFAHVKLLERENAHLDEIDVHPDHGRRGIGRALVRTVCSWASSIGLRGVTLSTFRSVPWNAPFYTSMGFRVLHDSELSPALRRVVADETQRGLDIGARVMMWWDTSFAHVED